MTVAIALAIILALAGGAVLLAGSIWAARHREKVAERLRGLAITERRRAVGGARLARLAWLNRVGAALVGDSIERRELQEMLSANGFHGLRPLHLFAVGRLAVALMAAGGIGGWALVRGAATTDLAAQTVLAFILGFLACKHVLRMRAATRQTRLRGELSFVLDLMTLALEAGVNLDQCLRYAGQNSARVAPLVHAGLTNLVQDLDKGTPYEAALDRWGERLGVAEGRELAGLFRQSLLYGAELGTTLRAFIEEFASRRLTTARERVGQKAVQLTVVTVVFMLPPLMAVIGGPALAALLDALG